MGLLSNSPPLGRGRGWAFLLSRNHADKIVRPHCPTEIFSQSGISFFTVLHDATTVVHIVGLLALLTSGNALAVDSQPVGGRQRVVVATYAVGTLQVVSHKAAVRFVYQGLETDDDAVVEAQDELRHLLLFRLGLLGTAAVVVFEYYELPAGMCRLADDAEDAP